MKISQLQEFLASASKDDLASVTGRKVRRFAARFTNENPYRDLNLSELYALAQLVFTEEDATDLVLWIRHAVWDDADMQQSSAYCQQMFKAVQHLKRQGLMREEFLKAIKHRENCLELAEQIVALREHCQLNEPEIAFLKNYPFGSTAAAELLRGLQAANLKYEDLYHYFIRSNKSPQEIREKYLDKLVSLRSSGKIRIETSEQRAETLQLVEQLAVLPMQLIMDDAKLRFLQEYNYGVVKAGEILVTLYQYQLCIPEIFLPLLKIVKSHDEIKVYIANLNDLHAAELLMADGKPRPKLLELLALPGVNGADLLHAFKMLKRTGCYDEPAIHYFALMPGFDPDMMARSLIQLRCPKEEAYKNVKVPSHLLKFFKSHQYQPAASTSAENAEDVEYINPILG